MYGFNNQTNSQLSHDIKIIKKLDPPHISCYQLTIEKDTQFYRKRPVLPSNDELEAMQTFIENSFKKNYTNYEVSAFAKKILSVLITFIIGRSGIILALVLVRIVN